MNNINKTIKKLFDDEYMKFNHWIEIIVNLYYYNNILS